MTVSTNNTYNNAPTTASVAGGTIDNAPIGSTTPSTGAFTTLSATGQSTIAAGTVSAPSLTLSTDTTTGLYRIGANNDGYAVSGAKVLDIGSTGLAVTGTLSATSGAAIGGATAGTGGIAFPATQVPSADVNNLDDYAEYTQTSAACTGAVTANASWVAVKVGRVVTLRLSSVLGAGVAVPQLQFPGALPASFRPAADTTMSAGIMTNNAAIQANNGCIYVSASTGSIQVFLDFTTGANFTVTANAGLTTATAVSWIAA